MTRMLVACALSLAPVLAAAQSDPDLIAQATLPLPEQLRGGATVVVEADDHGARRPG